MKNTSTTNQSNQNISLKKSTEDETGLSSAQVIQGFSGERDDESDEKGDRQKRKENFQESHSESPPSSSTSEKQVTLKKANLEIPKELLEADSESEIDPVNKNKPQPSHVKNQDHLKKELQKEEKTQEEKRPAKDPSSKKEEEQETHAKQLSTQQQKTVLPKEESQNKSTSGEEVITHAEAHTSSKKVGKDTEVTLAGISEDISEEIYPRGKRKELSIAKNPNQNKVGGLKNAQVIQDSNEKDNADHSEEQNQGKFFKDDTAENGEELQKNLSGLFPSYERDPELQGKDIFEITKKIELENYAHINDQLDIIIPDESHLHATNKDIPSIKRALLIQEGTPIHKPHHMVYNPRQKSNPFHKISADKKPTEELKK